MVEFGSLSEALSIYDPEHYIEWIQIITEDGNPTGSSLNGEPPVAEFCVDAEVVTAREYCNLHGLWRADGP